MLNYLKCVFVQPQNFLCFCLLVYLFTAQFLVSLANLEGEETFEASMLGQAEEVCVERVCDDELILIKR